MMNEGKLSIPFFPDTEDICQSTKQLTNMICHTEDYKCYQKDLAVLKAQEELYHKFKEFRGKACIYSWKENRNSTLKEWSRFIRNIKMC